MTCFNHSLIRRSMLFAMCLSLPFALQACSESDHTNHSDHQSPAPSADHDHDHAHPTTAPAAQRPMIQTPYLLATDPVTGEDLPTRPVTLQHDGREFRFASQMNADTFEAAASDYIPAVDEQMVASQLPHYPLDTCVVTGAPLGSMGDPVDHIHQNRLVRFCCAACLDPFNEDPEKHLAAIDEAIIAQQKADYPLDVCVVSGEGLHDHGEPMDMVFGTRLVRLCCSGCVRAFTQNPARYFAALDAGQPAATSTSHDHSHNHDHDH